MWDVAGWLLLLMGGVLCGERCGGVRRACAVRVCVLERACVCVAVCAPVWAVGCAVLCACSLCCAVLLLLVGSVLCVWRCAGVRRACAVRVCELDTRVRLRCWARAGVSCVVCCVVRLFTVLCGAGLAGRAARWAAARCGWLCAREMVCGGRSARPSRSAAARGAGMWSALYVRLLRGWRAKFPCGEGRAYVFTLWARAGAEGGADSPRSASVGLRRGEGGRVGGLAAIACTRGRKKKSLWA